MNEQYKLAIEGVVCLFLSFLAIPYFQNKDYQLNGVERIISPSKYGELTKWLSILLLVILSFTIQKGVDLLIDKNQLTLTPLVYNITYWALGPLLSMAYVAGIVWINYVNYKIRKAEKLKYADKGK